jgi:hypothetical protein
MRDPELVARAQRAAARLESAWERWRALQGLADTPPQSVVGYVGYALKEPWEQPRAVIGFSADEAERLAEFLERGAAGGSQPSGYPQTQQQAVTVPQQTSEPSRQLLTAQPKPDVVAVTSQLSGSQHCHSLLQGRSDTLKGQEPDASAPLSRASGLGTARPRPESRLCFCVRRGPLG